MSLDSQRAELDRVFAGRVDIEIVETLLESRSAKEPGRRVFNDMIARIEAGEADGIVAWAPDRLSRNSIDGGRLIYLLDKGVIKDLKFATYTYENNSQGKFMLAIMFGQSKYYSDALSENVRRGLRTKLDLGWYPGSPPFGYRNNPRTREIELHPDYAPYVQRMFKLVLEGLSPPQIVKIARDSWGLRMPSNRRSFGKPLSLSNLQRSLRNPFYTGLMVWNGVTYEGRHEALVTPADFQLVQSRICRPAPSHPQRHSFAYTGTIRCGACGLFITAQYVTNRHGTRYTYYFCTKRGDGPRCEQPAIRREELEKQIASFLGRLWLPEDIRAMAVETLRGRQEQVLALERAARQNNEKELADIERRIGELTRLKLRGLLSDEEFARERGGLFMERQAVQSALAKRPSVEATKSAELALTFAAEACEAFKRGGDDDRSAIFKMVAEKPLLMEKKLSGEAVKPLQLIESLAQNVFGWTERHADQTPSLSTEPICRFADEWCSWVCENPDDAERLSQKAKPILAMDDAPIVRSRLIGPLDVSEVPNVPAVIDSDLRRPKRRSSPKAA